MDISFILPDKSDQLTTVSNKTFHNKFNKASYSQIVALLYTFTQKSFEILLDKELSNTRNLIETS